MRVTLEEQRAETGRRVAGYRKERGLTQAELARRARIPRSSLSMLESGRYMPTVLRLQALAAHLSVRWWELVPEDPVDGIPGTP